MYTWGSYYLHPKLRIEIFLRLIGMKFYTNQLLIVKWVICMYFKGHMSLLEVDLYEFPTNQFVKNLFP